MTGGSSEVLDLDRGLARVSGDRELYFELLDMLLEDADRQVREIGEAIEAGDAKRIEYVAHSLKGAAASLEAGRVRDVALRLEEMGRGGSPAGAAGVLAELEAESKRLRRFAESLE